MDALLQAFSQKSLALVAEAFQPPSFLFVYIDGWVWFSGCLAFLWDLDDRQEWLEWPTVCAICMTSSRFSIVRSNGVHLSSFIELDETLRDCQEISWLCSCLSFSWALWTLNSAFPFSWLSLTHDKANRDICCRWCAIWISSRSADI